MESILHFALFRKEELEMLCQGDFEQQKQRFHMSTINFLEMLPDQPRNKLLETASRLQSRRMPSCFDKENLAGSQTVSKASALKCPGTRGRNSRALGDMKCNIVSNMSSWLLQSPRIQMADTVSPRADNSFQKEISLHSGFPNGSASQDEDRFTTVESGLGIVSRTLVGGSVEVKDDEGAGMMLCDPAPEREMDTLPQGNERTQGRQRDLVAQIPREDVFEVLDDPKIAVVGRVQEARTDGILKESKGRREGKKGNDEQGIHAAEIHNRSESCHSQQVDIHMSEETSLPLCRRQGTRREKKAAVLVTEALPRASKRVTRSSARQSETVLQTEVATTAQHEPTPEPARKKSTRRKAKQLAAIMPPLLEEAGVTDDKPRHIDHVLNFRSSGTDSLRGGQNVEDTLISIEAMQTGKTHEETCQGLCRLPSLGHTEGTQSQYKKLSQQVMTEELPSKKICRRLVGSAAFSILRSKDPEVRAQMDKEASYESSEQTSAAVTASAVSLQFQNVSKIVSSDKSGDLGIIVEAGTASSAGRRSIRGSKTVSLSAGPVVEVGMEPLPCIQMNLPKRHSVVVALPEELEEFEPIIAVSDTDNTKLFHVAKAGGLNGSENALENPTGNQELAQEGQEGSCKAARKSFLIRISKSSKESQTAPSLRMARESSEGDARVHYEDCRRDQVSSEKLGAPKLFKSPPLDETNLHLYECGDQFSTPGSDDEIPESVDLLQVSMGKQAGVSRENVLKSPESVPPKPAFEKCKTPSALSKAPENEDLPLRDGRLFPLEHKCHPKVTLTFDRCQSAKRLSAMSASESSEEDAQIMNDKVYKLDQHFSGELSASKVFKRPTVDGTNLPLHEYRDHTASKSMNISTLSSNVETSECGNLQLVSFGKHAGVSGEKVLRSPESDLPKLAINESKPYKTPLALLESPKNRDPPSGEGQMYLLEQEFYPVTLTLDRFLSSKRLSARSGRKSSGDARVMNAEDYRPNQVSSRERSAPQFVCPPVDATKLPSYEYGGHTAFESVNISTPSSEDETPEYENLQQGSFRKHAGVSGEKVLKSPESDPPKWAINESKEHQTPFALWKLPADEDPPLGEGRISLLEQEFHPEVTLTLDRFQFRKRLSARSKARARRWKSDIAVNGKDDGQWQPVVALPCRDVSSKEDFVELVESGMDLQTPTAERSLQEARLSLPGVVEAVQQIVVSQKPGEFPCPSMAALQYEPPDQVFQDGRGNGVNSQECAFMDVDNEQHESLKSSPLLQSIYTLSRVCENGLASDKEFLKKMESQQMQSLMASANQLIKQLSSKKGQPTTTTPTSSHSMLYTSDTVNDPFSPYPVRSELLSPGPVAYSLFPESPNCLSPYPAASSSRAVENPSEGIVPQLSNPMSSLPVSSLQVFVEPVLPSGLSTNAENLRNTKSLGQEDISCQNRSLAFNSDALISSLSCSDHVSPAPVLVNLNTPKFGLPTPAHCNILPCLPAGLEHTSPQVYPEPTAVNSANFNPIIASATGRQEDGSLGSDAMGGKSGEQVVERLTLDECITVKSGAKSKTPHQEQQRAVWSRLRFRLFGKGEDENIGSALVNEASDDLTSRIVIVSNPAVQEQDCSELPETLACPAEYGSNLLSGGKRSGLKASNTDKEALTEEPEPCSAVDELHVGVWKSSPASIAQVQTGVALASFVNNIWKETVRITPSPKEASEGSVRLADGGGIQTEERALTRTSQLTSPTTLQTKHAGGDDIIPLSTRGTSMQIQRCSQPTVFLGQVSPVVLSLESGLQASPAERTSILEVAISRADELSLQSNSTLSHQNLSDLKPVQPEMENVEGGCAQYSCGHPETLIPGAKVVKNAAALGEVDMLESLKSCILGQPAAPTPAQSQRINASIQSVQTQCPSNLRGVEFCANPSGPTIPRSNLVASMRSFIPLVHQQQPAAPYPNGKREVKVRALEAAEAARREAEQRELEKQERKKAMAVARREKTERAAQETKTPGTERPDEDPRKATVEATKKKAVPAGTTKSLLVDSSNNSGTSIQGVHLKVTNIPQVKRAVDSKSKMEQDKLEKLQEEQRRKEEEWKRKEAEAVVRKRKQEYAEKKEREVKRKRQVDVMNMHREMEDRQRAQLQEKLQKRKALEESGKERKALEEETRRQKRMDKEKEAERRRKEDMDVKTAWLEGKDATRKRKEETVRLMKEFEGERQLQAAKLVRMSGNPAISGNGSFRSFMSSMRLATSVDDATGAVPVTGANHVERHRTTSQSLLNPPIRVPRTTADGTGAFPVPSSKLQAERTRSNSQGLAIRVPCITSEGMGIVALPGSKLQAERTRSNSQGLLGTAIRVPHVTTEGATSGCILIAGSGQFLPLEAVTKPVLGSCAAPYCGGPIPAASGLSERINLLHSQPGPQNAGSLVAVASKGFGPAQAGHRLDLIAMGGAGLQSYDISPFRDSSDDDSEDENKRPQKMIPQWARKENLMVQLVRQLQQDPDELFASATSCSLDEVFETTGSKKRPDFKRRGSSGDWVQDHLTWQEEIRYKTTMGYLH